MALVHEYEPSISTKARNFVTGWTYQLFKEKPAPWSEIVFISILMGWKNRRHVEPVDSH
jgi:hypothetical protein